MVDWEIEFPLNLGDTVELELDMAVTLPGYKSSVRRTLIILPTDEDGVYDFKLSEPERIVVDERE
jgi:hypothetical protein